MSFFEPSAKSLEQETICPDPDSQTRWIHSPVGRHPQLLHLGAHLELRPYFGRRRKIHFFRTEYSIGRAQNNSIQWEDPYLSEHHCQIKYVNGQGYLVEDLNSKNGVWLNGTRVKQAFLPSQGILRLGRSSFFWDTNLDSALQAAQVEEGVIAESQIMKDLLQEIAVLASGNISVLFLGETGTGKDLLARLLHRWGPRKNTAMVAMNAAQAEGNLVDSELFGHKRGSFTGAESSRMGALMRANHGTFFLDEVADLPLATQVKLLRTLETGEVKPVGSDLCENSNFRLITATSRALEPLLRADRFRWDFYYRIAGAVVKIPPLRERPEDIKGIANQFARKNSIVITDKGIERLCCFSWPGNARQLSNVLKLAQQRSKRRKSESMDADDIELPIENQPALVLEPSSEVRTLANMEKIWIEKTLQRTGGGRSQAAQELGIARSTLFEKMRRYQILNY